MGHGVHVPVARFLRQNRERNPPDTFSWTIRLLMLVSMLSGAPNAGGYHWRFLRPGGGYVDAESAPCR
jgi:hypothetical protein